MSTNPYAQQTSPPGQFEEPIKKRTSILAVLSLVCGIISVLLCCVGVIPGTLAVVLGIASVLLIGGSAAVGGKGLAITGIITGLLGSLISIVLMIGGSNFASMMSTTYGGALAAIEADNRGNLDALLTSSTAQALTDERIDEFRAIYSNELGSFVSGPKGLQGWFDGFGAVGPSINPAMADAQQTFGAGAQVFPLPGNFQGGAGLVMIVIDQTQPTAAGAPAIIDMGYVAKDGSVQWLVKDAAQPPSP